MTAQWSTQAAHRAVRGRRLAPGVPPIPASAVTYRRRIDRYFVRRTAFPGRLCAADRSPAAGSLGSHLTGTREELPVGRADNKGPMSLGCVVRPGQNSPMRLDRSIAILGLVARIPHRVQWWEVRGDDQHVGHQHKPCASQPNLVHRLDDYCAPAPEGQRNGQPRPSFPGEHR